MNIDVLDHGYVGLVESWGTDARIIEAARMSTAKGFLGWSCWKCDACGLELQEQQTHTAAPGVFCPSPYQFTRIPRDEKLLEFLYVNKHHTPFEMVGLTIEVKAPIFVFREWHRHRVPFGYNEMSARYIPLPDENYVPGLNNIQARIATGGGNKQAGSASQYIPSDDDVDGWLDRLKGAYRVAQDVYEEGLRLGIPKEVARLPVPVARYSRMRATSNLRGWLGFLELRMAKAAQWEIRQYANAVGDLVAEAFPQTWALFSKGKL